MEAKIVKIGNSLGVRLPKALLQQYDLKDAIELVPTEQGILLQPKKKGAREGWEEQFKKAVEEYGPPDVDDDWISFGNEWDKTEPPW